MKKTIFVLLLMVVIFSTSALADNCGGTRRCHCGDWVVENHTMWYDLNDCGSMGLGVVYGSTLDCNGHLIDGDNTGGADGISVSAPRATVKNCNVREFGIGINLWKSSYDNLIIENNVSNNQFDGILVGEDSDRNMVEGNILTFNGRSGIFTYYSSGNIILENTISNNNEGLRIYQSSNNDIWGNTLMNNNANAYESYDPNNWNLNRIGNYWDDFPSNPGYPYQYEIPGPGNGIDWHPVGELPWVWINLTPTGNTTFPPTGGRLNYNILVGNNEDTTVRLDIWLNVIMPNGTVYLIHRPLLNFEMPPGFSTSRDKTINIPRDAPAGEYSLNSYLGIYNITTPVIYAEDYFNFTKEF